jgi:hypothetical protein
MHTLVDYTGRMFREGKAAISAGPTRNLGPLGSDADRWWSRIDKPSRGRLLGRAPSSNRVGPNLRDQELKMSRPAAHSVGAATPLR